MPISSPDHSPTVLHFIRSLQPKSILDVGVGTGSYRLLLRQYLDVAQQRIRPENWLVHIDGVEVFEAYRNPVWDFAYDNVYVGDIRELERELADYGVVLCNDVLAAYRLSYLVSSGLARSDVASFAGRSAVASRLGTVGRHIGWRVNATSLPTHCPNSA